MITKHQYQTIVNAVAIGLLALLTFYVAMMVIGVINAA